MAVTLKGINICVDATSYWCCSVKVSISTSAPAATFVQKDNCLLLKVTPSRIHVIKHSILHSTKFNLLDEKIQGGVLFATMLR